MTQRRVLKNSRYPTRAYFPFIERPMYEAYHRFDDLKYAWVVAHQDATLEEDLAASNVIAKQCGI